MLGFIIGLSITCLVLIFITINLYRKVLRYEDIAEELDKQNKQFLDWFTNVKTNIEIIYNRLDEIDNKGIFKADDEIGWMWSQVKDIGDYLKSILNPDNGQGEKEK